MRPRRRREKVGLVLAGCAVALAGAVTALVVPNVGYESTTYGGLETTAPAPTTGAWTPIVVKRPKLPVIAGGIPVDIDPSTSRSDFSTTLFPLGARRYRMTIFNTSSLGAINSLQWYPPTGVRIVKLVGTSEGRCRLTGLKGFGGNQFPTVVLYPNVLCEKLDLEPPSCTCLGDGGTMTISFVTDNEYGGGSGELRMHKATLVFDRVPTYIKPGSTAGTPG